MTDHGHQDSRDRLGRLKIKCAPGSISARGNIDASTPQAQPQRRDDGDVSQTYSVSSDANRSPAVLAQDRAAELPDHTVAALLELCDILRQIPLPNESEPLSACP
jgi:hypothetical protein